MNYSIFELLLTYNFKNIEFLFIFKSINKISYDLFKLYKREKYLTGYGLCKCLEYVGLDDSEFVKQDLTVLGENKFNWSIISEYFEIIIDFGDIFDINQSHKIMKTENERKTYYKEDIYSPQYRLFILKEKFATDNIMKAQWNSTIRKLNWYKNNKKFIYNLIN